MNIARYLDTNLLCSDIITGSLPLAQALDFSTHLSPDERSDLLTLLHRRARAAFRLAPTPALQALLDDITEEELDTCA